MSALLVASAIYMLTQAHSVGVEHGHGAEAMWYFVAVVLLIIETPQVIRRIRG